MYKKIIWIIVIIIFTLLIYSAVGRQPTMSENFITVSIQEDNIDNGYVLDIEYPQFIDTTPATQFMNSDIEEYIDEKVSHFTNTSKEIADWAENNNVSGVGIEGGSSLYIRYDVPVTREMIVAVRFNVSEYSAGAAHPNTVAVTKSYDTSSPKLLSLEDLFEDGTDYLSVMAKYAQDDIVKQLREAGVEEPMSDWVRRGTAPEEDNYRSFLPEAEHLTIIFDPYQVAAYAFGLREVHIPWSKFPGLPR